MPPAVEWPLQNGVTDMATTRVGRNASRCTTSPATFAVPVQSVGASHPSGAPATPALLAGLPFAAAATTALDAAVVKDRHDPAYRASCVQCKGSYSWQSKGSRQSKCGWQSNGEQQEINGGKRTREAAEGV